MAGEKGDSTPPPAEGKLKKTGPASGILPKGEKMTDMLPMGVTVANKNLPSLPEKVPLANEMIYVPELGACWTVNSVPGGVVPFGLTKPLNTRLAGPGGPGEPGGPVGPGGPWLPSTFRA